MNAVLLKLSFALRLHRAGHLAEAVQIYRDALDIDPDHAETNHLLGLAVLQSGQAGEAFEHLSRAAAAAPTNIDCRVRLGIACDALGKAADAERQYGEALALDPAHAEAHNNLGILLARRGALDEAKAALRRAIEIKPDYAAAHYNMAIVLRDQRRTDAAYLAFSRAVEIKPDFVDAWRDLANMLVTAGKSEAAIECYGRVRDMEPSHPSANHMLAALTGQTTESAPQAYVKELFDHYASTFDSHLVKTLAYRTPDMLREEVDGLVTGGARFDDVIDLGCGTGLCGRAFREMSGRIHGIDLSPKMIAEARGKDLYDSLEVGDILECLREKAQTYDLFLSADVFIYVGGLDDIFGAVRARARPEALFAFSVEASDGDGFELLRTGRYAHSRNYIEGLAATHDFTIGQRREIVVRQDHGHPIDGFIYVLKAGKSN